MTFSCLYENSFWLLAVGFWLPVPTHLSYLPFREPPVCRKAGSYGFPSEELRSHALSW